MLSWLWVLTLVAVANARNFEDLATKLPDIDAVDRLRRYLVYPYHPDDYQDWITDATPNVPLQLPFQLPYMGLLVNYASISLHGYVSFNTETRVPFPLEFPADHWPYRPDPTFLGPYVTPSAIGTSDDHKFRPGVYLRVYSNIGVNDIQEEIDLKSAIQEDIRNASFDPFFKPKHVIIITWRNVTLKGNDDTKLSNTYQVIITSDEKLTYSIFNYENLRLAASNPAPFVGFNVGNNSGGFEYLPHSRSAQLPHILQRGQSNRFRGRHIFRIDHRLVQPFACNVAPGPEERLYLSAVSGDIRGGDEVNVTGPCFDVRYPIDVHFNNHSVQCVFRSRHRASCITPSLGTVGLVDVQLRNDSTIFKAKLYSQDSFWSSDNVKVTRNENNFEGPVLIQWDTSRFHSNHQQLLNITLVGFREQGGRISMVHLMDIDHLVTNQRGYYRIYPENYYNATSNIDFYPPFGMMQLYPAFSNPRVPSAYKRILWSKPMPLDWLFHKKWERVFGKEWARFICDQWLAMDQHKFNISDTVPACPCTRPQITGDKGRFVPVIECALQECASGIEFKNCFRSGQPTMAGSSQQCCYNEEGELILNHDSQDAAGHPTRTHPHIAEEDFPWMSYLLNDGLGMLSCCKWLGNTSEGCQSFYHQRRSDDCSEHHPPNSATVYGDPHVITFDDLPYTFNGKGEYTLLTAQDEHIQLEIQGRFQQVLDGNIAEELNATQLTAVVIKENDSCIVEVQLPPVRHEVSHSLQSVPRIYINGEEIHPQLLTDPMFFLPMQGVTLYRKWPSDIVASFPSGMGVEFSAGEAPNPLGVIVYLPPTFKNSTAGLLGSWSSGVSNQMMPPADLHLPPVTLPTSAYDIHQNFGMHWAVTDEGVSGRPGSKSLFKYEYDRSSKFYADENFEPFLGNGINNITDQSWLVCSGFNSQCRFDYVVTENEQLARNTLKHSRRFTATKEKFKEVTRCPALPNPPHGKKDTTERTIKTKVTFSCDKGFVLQGEETRFCENHGQWSTIEMGATKCVPEGLSTMSTE